MVKDFKNAKGIEQHSKNIFFGDKDITLINKGLFTSCKKNDKCPPWSIKADQIEHDRNKKQLKYKQAFIQIYDFPVFYFPKFYHPDPSVKRQSGLLKPEINNSSCQLSC